MTPRQNEVYLVIDEFWRMYGYGPTVDDIMGQLGIKSRNSVHRMMKRLVEMGACKHVPNRSRTIRPAGLRFTQL